ncbi:MAG TPA: pyridoxamine 5'-phosphate oxidase family protein [Ignavibacteriaceae bacterium]|nr:pyridoxamine 5'-phosphate oxidase family protein [Ignavibacteriaceae bacterium]
MKKSIKLNSIFLIGIFLLISDLVSAQENKPEVNRDSVIAAAHEIIGMQNYCALITIDSAGLPNVRTMNPYPVEDNMIVWMATNRVSRKANEIRNNPNVCVYFADHKAGTGYVAINGKAEVIDDKDLLVKKKREYWEQAVPDWKNVLVLIKVVPVKLEIVNYKYRLYGDPVTWKSPFIKFEETKAE